MHAHLLGVWELRPEVPLALLLAAGMFLAGWRRLRGASGRGFVKGWRLASYLGGLAVLALALLSPIDTLSSYLLSVHMVQHLLLMMIVPVLLLVANPLPFTLWGLPQGVRRWVGKQLARGSFFRRMVAPISSPGPVWIAMVIVLVVWHEPRAYDAALRSELWHDLEHLSFFTAAMLFWWHVTGAGPRLHGSISTGMRIAYLLVMFPVTMAVGIGISMSSGPLYLNYLTVPRVMGLSLMDDQRLAGAIMWIPGSMMFILAALLLIARAIGAEERKPPLAMGSPMADLPQGHSSQASTAQVS